MILAVAVSVLMVVGALFSLAAAIGLVRLPDLYSRMHAASKAGTVGSGLMLVAAGLHAGDAAILARAAAGFVFFILTAPIAAHLLARAAHQAGFRLQPPSVRDDLEQSQRHHRGSN